MEIHTGRRPRTTCFRLLKASVLRNLGSSKGIWERDINNQMDVPTHPVEVTMTLPVCTTPTPPQLQPNLKLFFHRLKCKENL